MEHYRAMLRRWTAQILLIMTDEERYAPPYETDDVTVSARSN